MYSGCPISERSIIDLPCSIRPTIRYHNIIYTPYCTELSSQLNGLPPFCPWIAILDEYSPSTIYPHQSHSSTVIRATHDASSHAHNQRIDHCQARLLPVRKQLPAVHMDPEPPANAVYRIVSTTLRREGEPTSKPAHKQCTLPHIRKWI
jgi:hypothetical protein